MLKAVAEILGRKISRTRNLFEPSLVSKVAWIEANHEIASDSKVRAVWVYVSDTRLPCLRISHVGK